LAKRSLQWFLVFSCLLLFIFFFCNEVFETAFYRVREFLFLVSNFFFDLKKKFLVQQMEVCFLTT